MSESEVAEIYESAYGENAEKVKLSAFDLAKKIKEQKTAGV